MRKTHELSLEKTIEFARHHYGDQKTITGGAVLKHCQDVATLAETIAQRLYRDIRPDYFPDPKKDSIITIVHAALLHDVFTVSSCAFEHIAEITTVQIAVIVADLSRDFRLVETKRDIEFRGRLSQSPVIAQIIETAHIICTAKNVLEWLKKEGPPAAAQARKILGRLDGDLLAVHAASKYYILRMYVHAARNLLTDISQQIKTCKQQVKQAKTATNLEKALREKGLLSAPSSDEKRMAAKVKGNARKKSPPKNS